MLFSAFFIVSPSGTYGLCAPKNHSASKQIELLYTNLSLFSIDSEFCSRQIPKTDGFYAGGNKNHAAARMSAPRQPPKPSPFFSSAKPFRWDSPQNARGFCNSIETVGHQTIYPIF
jgi:hypothetical protein